MENLQNTITKTDTLKNDLKLAKQKINDKILSGGGTIADTLNAVPNAIDKMLGNYKKIAIIELSSNNVFNHTCERSYPDDIDKVKNFEVATLNLDFIPNKLYINSNTDGNEDDGFGLCELNNTYTASHSSGFTKYKFKLNDKKIVLNSTIERINNICTFNFTVRKIIAIE